LDSTISHRHPHRLRRSLRMRQMRIQTTRIITGMITPRMRMQMRTWRVMMTHLRAKTRVPEAARVISDAVATGTVDVMNQVVEGAAESGVIDKSKSDAIGLHEAALRRRNHL
jgi:hypothetical protein